MIEDSPRLKRCFPLPPVVAYRRSKNIRDMLVRAKMPPTRKTSSRKKVGFKNCGTMCALCPFASTSDQHTNTKTGQSWKIHSVLNCKSKNVVYKISCIKCQFVYIGETQRRLQDRAAEHRGYVRRKVLQHPVGEHFNSRGHNIADMRFVAIEQVRPLDDTLIRCQRERLWINTYDSIDSGANRRR